MQLMGDVCVGDGALGAVRLGGSPYAVVLVEGREGLA